MPSSVRRRPYQRNTRPRPAPATALAPTTRAACAAHGPVGRSCAYGGRENPIVVSQPIPASGTAVTGSAAAATTPVISTQAISTPVAESRPCSPAATVPTARNMAKPAGSALGAGIARPRRGPNP